MQKHIMAGDFTQCDTHQYGAQIRHARLKHTGFFLGLGCFSWAPELTATVLSVVVGEKKGELLMIGGNLTCYLVVESSYDSM